MAEEEWPSARIEVAPRPHRLRLLNACNTRTLKLAWSDGSPLTVIATDGGLLAAIRLPREDDQWHPDSVTDEQELRRDQGILGRETSDALYLVTADRTPSEMQGMEERLTSRLNEIATFDYRIPRPRQKWAHVDVAPRRLMFDDRIVTLVRSTPAQLSASIDVLNDVAEMAYTHTDKDILRLYEIWLKTGSRRAEQLLKENDVVPIRSGGGLSRH